MVWVVLWCGFVWFFGVVFLGVVWYNMGNCLKGCCFLWRNIMFVGFGVVLIRLVLV